MALRYPEMSAPTRCVTVVAGTLKQRPTDLLSFTAARSHCPQCNTSIAVQRVTDRRYYDCNTKTPERNLHEGAGAEVPFVSMQ